MKNIKNINKENYLVVPSNHFKELYDELTENLIDSTRGHNKWFNSLGKADASVYFDPHYNNVRYSFLDKKEILEEHILPFRGICCFSDHPFFNGNIMYSEPDLIVNAIWEPVEQAYFALIALNKQFITRKGREEFANAFMHTRLKTHVYSLCDRRFLEEFWNWNETSAEYGKR